MPNGANINAPNIKSKNKEPFLLARSFPVAISCIAIECALSDFSLRLFINVPTALEPSLNNILYGTIIFYGGRAIVL